MDSVCACGTGPAPSGYLAVPDAGVAVGVGGEDTAQCRDAHLVLEGSVLRHGAVQVPLDLLRSQRRPAQRLLHQLAVVARVAGQFVLGSWTKGDMGLEVKVKVQSGSVAKNPDGPENSNHSSPRSRSGIPLRTSSLVLEVRYMQTPRPNSEKWMFQASSFIFSFICRSSTDRPWMELQLQQAAPRTSWSESGWTRRPI